MSTIPRLQASGITVRFGGLTALDRIDLMVPPASVAGLMGPNGAGKSTLFGVLSGLRRPEGGTVHIDGHDVTRASPQARARLGLARTFQHPELFAELSVRDHLVLAHRLHATPRRLWTDALTVAGFRAPARTETDRVERLLDTLGLTRFVHEPVNALPLGRARLLEVGRALAREPRVLLLDEPFSGLDAGETDELTTMLQAVVRDQGVSLLLVERDVDLVLRLSDWVYVLDVGRAITDGPPPRIARDPGLRAAYLETGNDGSKGAPTSRDAHEERGARRRW